MIFHQNVTYFRGTICAPKILLLNAGEIGPWRNRPLEKSAPKRLGPISPEKSAPVADFSGEIGPNRNFGEIVPIVKFYIYRCCFLKKYSLHLGFI